jgi:hypothetical protein
MGLIGRVEDYLPARHYGLGFPELNHRRGEQANSGMAMLLVVPVEELLTESAAVLRQPKRSGNSGRYFMVRNWLSEVGLSSET